MRPLIVALCLTAAPPTLMAQVTLDAAQDSAATEMIVRLASQLESRDSLWRTSPEVVVILPGTDHGYDAAAVVERHFGTKATTAQRIDSITACPIGGAGQWAREACVTPAGVQVLSISSPRCGGSGRLRCRYLVTLSQQGRDIPSGSGRSSLDRNGRTWRIVLEADGKGGFRMHDNPGLLIP